MRKQGKKGFMLVFPLLGMQTELLCLHHPFHRQIINLHRNPLPRVIQAAPLSLRVRCSESTENVSSTETETRRSAIMNQIVKKKIG